MLGSGINYNILPGALESIIYDLGEKFEFANFEFRHVTHITRNHSSSIDLIR